MKDSIKRSQSNQEEKNQDLQFFIIDLTLISQQQYNNNKIDNSVNQNGVE